MSISHLGALICARPDEAKTQILSAIVEASGDRKKAAELLGTTHRSFYRFVERLKLWDEIDAAIAEHGFLVIPGPPRSSEKIKGAILMTRGDINRAARQLEIKPEMLRARIEELQLWDDINATLKASKFKPISRENE